MQLLYRHRCVLIIVIVYSVLACCNHVEETMEFCEKPSKDSTDSIEPRCHQASKLSKRPKYILYDVNPPEGFNLRRDVYMRMAIFASKLPKSEDWHLVLPPWNKLYHWHSTDVGHQSQLPWGQFFDIPSLQKFAPVVEMYQFLEDYGSRTINQVYVLQHYKDAFKSNKWEEKYDFEPCQDKIPYRYGAIHWFYQHDLITCTSLWVSARIANSRLHENGTYSGWFWGYSNISAQKVDCLSFHGLASQLKHVLSNFTSVKFDHAEIALHDFFGDRTYWRARRSMRFATNLRRLADEFRLQYIDSSDETDSTVIPNDWRDEKPRRNAKGGNYLCVHLRRQDFLWGRPKDVPTIQSTALQIIDQLHRQKLDTVFVATDASANEIEELRNYMHDYHVLVYGANETVRKTFKDGGVAIIEQIICSHARYFIGTHESTFSFRIQEEREIIGFPTETTFNRLCGDNDTKCKPPSQWKIVF